jgi:hypothetical protein
VEIKLFREAVLRVLSPFCQPTHSHEAGPESEYYTTYRLGAQFTPSLVGDGICSLPERAVPLTTIPFTAGVSHYLNFSVGSHQTISLFVLDHSSWLSPIQILSQDIPRLPESWLFLVFQIPRVSQC